MIKLLLMFLNKVKKTLIKSAVPPGLFALMGFCGCAGPSTPLGALWTVTPPQRVAPIQKSNFKPDLSTSNFKSDFGVYQDKKSLTNRLLGRPEIRLKPARQVLHGPSQIQITVDDSLDPPDRDHLKIYYDRLDVTESFLSQAEVSMRDNHTQMVIRVPNIRLQAYRDHDIHLVYNKDQSKPVTTEFKPPLCQAYEQKLVHHTGPFRPSPELLDLISYEAEQQGFSPAFLTALIAQESGFNPMVVSWAKAMGLTQVTPIADQEIQKKYPHWPRFPNVSSMPVSWLKTLIALEKINPDNDWRMDIQRSIRGGITFAQMIADRWYEDQNYVVVKSLWPNSTDHELSKLILASYHSGFARIRYALKLHGRDWMAINRLREARFYVNRIMSYCFHFSHLDV